MIQKSILIFVFASVPLHFHSTRSSLQLKNLQTCLFVCHQFEVSNICHLYHPKITSDPTYYILLASIIRKASSQIQNLPIVESGLKWSETRNIQQNHLLIAKPLEKGDICRDVKCGRSGNTKGELRVKKVVFRGDFVFLFGPVWESATPPTHI